MHDPDLIRSLCRQISTEKDATKTEELLSLLRSVIAEDLEDTRIRLAFLREKYGFAISDSKAAD